MIRRYAQSPPVVAGYDLDDVFSIVVPIARTNLVTNPSFETNTTSWTAIGGSIARSTAQQYHGAYSLEVTPTSSTGDGVRFDTVSLTSGTTYAVSAKVLGAGGVAYKLTVHTTAGTELIKMPFRGTGRWQWVWLYYTETSTTTRRVEVLKDNDRSTALFWIDGVQVEALGSLAETVSTYIDGDQIGLVPNQQPPAYLWTGTPHASTSTRSGLTRAGGMVVRFKDYSFLLTAIIGLGMAGVQNVRTEYARLDGAYDDYTRKPTRNFNLVGTFSGRSYQELRDNRSQIARLLDRDLVGLDQRMALLHHVEGPCGDVMTNESRILCKYSGGLGGNTNNHAAEDAAIQFEQYLPFVASDAEAGGALTVQQNVTAADDILQRTPGGVWQALGTGANDDVETLAIGPDGSIYAGGLFSLAGGVANTLRVAKWNGTAWSALTTGTNGEVRALAFAPNGDLYVGGVFTLAGGVANTVRIAKWNGSAWSALSVGVNATVLALVVASNGDLYVGGAFTNADGIANADYIAKWNGAAWSALGTGMSDEVRALAIGPDGTLYAGGIFVTAGGVTVNNIAKWNGSAWSAMGTTGVNSNVQAIAVGPNGLVYAGGLFTTAGGVAANAIAVWNGTAWQPLGSGITGGAATVFAITVSPNGLIYAGGFFTTAGGVVLSDALAVWNGATWTAGADVDLPGSASIQALALSQDGSLTVGYTTTGTAVAAGITTVTNSGTAKAYPTLKITGPTTGTSRIYQLVNYTTGRAIYFNYTIAAGETARFVFQPDALSFTSTFTPNLASKILPGSNESDFFLQPGANSISFFSADSTVTAVLTWRPQFVSLDDVR